MHIRRASLDDATAIATLSDQLGYPSTERVVRACLSDLVKDGEHAVFIANGAANAVVGWIHVFRTKRVFTRSFAELGGMIVDEHCRGEGIGTQLLQAAEEWAQGASCSVIRIRTNVVRDQAHQFYQGLGYSLAKSQKVFVKSLEE